MGSTDRQTTIHVHPDSATLAETAAQRFAELGDAAISRHGCFRVALSGGSTPRYLYETLAAPTARARIDWERVHVFFGDERCVPFDHPDSNYHMAEQALLSKVPIPRTQIHRMVTNPHEARRDAWHYANLLRGQLPVDEMGVPRFDLILLGLGPDGHTASLFPNSCILHERQRPVAAVYIDRLQVWRVSLTYPVLNHARHLMFLVAGADKAEIVHRILRTTPTGVPLPAQRIDAHGAVEWHLDAAAAQALDGEPSE